MMERRQVQIEIIGEAPKKGNYCYVAFDKGVRSSLLGILQLEEQLSQEFTIEQREEAIVAHRRFWKGLPEHYKSALCDLSHILLKFS